MKRILLRRWRIEDSGRASWGRHLQYQGEAFMMMIYKIISNNDKDYDDSNNNSNNISNNNDK